MLPPFTLDDLRHSVDMLHQQVMNGCGNHGCVIKPVSGAGTNSTCQCRPYRIARDLRRLAEAVDRVGPSWHKESDSPIVKSSSLDGSEVDFDQFCHCHPDIQSESMDDPDVCGNCGEPFAAK
jgi:hypothetical protein